MSGSSVAAVILYDQPHGLETVRSALHSQCPFQLCRQWALYAALACHWHVSSFRLPLSLFQSHIFCPFPALSTCVFSVYLSVSACPFILSLPPRLFPLSFSQMSLSSLCPSSSETRDPSQMGILINSVLRVTHFGSERENEGTHCPQHGQAASLSACCRGKNTVLQESRTLKLPESFFRAGKGFMVLCFILASLSEQGLMSLLSIYSSTCKA